MPDIEDFTRLQVAEFLPDAMEKALDSYNAFPEKATLEESKDFKAHHDARKMAIAHIRSLIELAKWADFPEEIGKVNQEKLAALITAAQGEVDRFENKES